MTTINDALDHLLAGLPGSGMGSNCVVFGGRNNYVRASLEKESSAAYNYDAVRLQHIVDSKTVDVWHVKWDGHFSVNYKIFQGRDGSTAETIPNVSDRVLNILEFAGVVPAVAMKASA